VILVLQDHAAIGKPQFRNFYSALLQNYRNKKNDLPNLRAQVSVSCANSRAHTHCVRGRRARVLLVIVLVAFRIQRFW